MNAYASDESGTYQIYVQPFPGPRAKYPVSTREGRSPRWTKGGRELFAIPEFQATYRSVRLPFEFQGPNDAEPQRHSLFLWQRVDVPPPSGRK